MPCFEQCWAPKQQFHSSKSQARKLRAQLTMKQANKKNGRMGKNNQGLSLLHSHALSHSLSFSLHFVNVCPFFLGHGTFSVVAYHPPSLSTTHTHTQHNIYTHTFSLYLCLRHVSLGACTDWDSEATKELSFASCRPLKQPTTRKDISFSRL